VLLSPSTIISYIHTIIPRFSLYIILSIDLAFIQLRSAIVSNRHHRPTTTNPRLHRFILIINRFFSVFLFSNFVLYFYSLTEVQTKLQCYTFLNSAHSTIILYYNSNILIIEHFNSIFCILLYISIDIDYHRTILFTLELSLEVF